MLELVALCEPRDVLDAGCGNGALAGHLAERGMHVVGIDADEQGILLARRTHPTIRFECVSFESPAIKLRATADGQFDCVISTEVVEHLYAPHELVNFCYEALRPGGTLIISTPYWGYAKNLAIGLLGRWDAHHTALWHGGHIKFWSRRSLTELLTKGGFEVTTFRGVGRVPYLWRYMILAAHKPTALSPEAAAK